MGGTKQAQMHGPSEHIFIRRFFLLEMDRSWVARVTQVSAAGKALTSAISRHQVHV
jgi:hypothetical protein